MSTISRAEAINAAGALLAAARQEMAQVYAGEGALGVARRARPGGSDEELERLASLYEGWQRDDGARRVPAEDQLGAPSSARPQADVGLKQSQAKHAAPRGTRFSAAVKLAVRDRAGGRCEPCGIWLGWHEGKVERRRAGDYPFCGTVHNACLFCGRCHLAAEQRDPRMNAAGFWLTSKEDPREVPVMLHNMDDCRVWLTETGSYSVTPPEDKTA